MADCFCFVFFSFGPQDDFVEVALNVCFSSPTASCRYSHNDSECYGRFHGDKANVLRRFKPHAVLRFFVTSNLLWQYKSWNWFKETILIGFRAGGDTISNAPLPWGACVMRTKTGDKKRRESMKSPVLSLRPLCLMSFSH